jgi:hypothetical protein
MTSARHIFYEKNGVGNLPIKISAFNKRRKWRFTGTKWITAHSDTRVASLRKMFVPSFSLYQVKTLRRLSTQGTE